MKCSMGKLLPIGPYYDDVNIIGDDDTSKYFKSMLESCFRWLLINQTRRKFLEDNTSNL